MLKFRYINNYYLYWRNNEWQFQQKLVKELREKTGAGMMDCKKSAN